MIALGEGGTYSWLFRSNMNWIGMTRLCKYLGYKKELYAGKWISIFFMVWEMKKCSITCARLQLVLFSLSHECRHFLFAINHFQCNGCNMCVIHYSLSVFYFYLTACIDYFVGRSSRASACDKQDEHSLIYLYNHAYTLCTHFCLLDQCAVTHDVLLSLVCTNKTH